MPSSRETIEALVDRPQESLAVELKGWFDPDSPKGVAKIARTCMALRNHNGGFLLVGVTDERILDGESAPADVETRFEPDKIQGVVSRYASEAFEVQVHFVERAGVSFPVIEVEAGVFTPVAAKRQLKDGGSCLIRKNAVYVRSLAASGVVSTTEVRWEDWPRLTRICFDNREADIGRFVRRHLSNLTPDVVRELVGSLGAMESDPSGEERARALLDDGQERYRQQLVQRALDLPGFGAMEVAAVVLGEVPDHAATDSFLRLLSASNPRYTGWPVWLDSSGHRDEASHPYVFEGAWEAFIWVAGDGWFGPHLDFWRLDPAGRFYLLRALQDDLETSGKMQPLTVLDFGLVILRVAEAIAVALVFARAMGVPSEESEVAFAFRWWGLQGRELGSWANPGRYISPGRRCMQDEVVTEARVPVDTPDSAITGHVHRIVRILFMAFGGFELSEKVVESLVDKLLNRRL